MRPLLAPVFAPVFTTVFAKLLGIALLLSAASGTAAGFGDTNRTLLPGSNAPSFLPVEEAYLLEVDVLDSGQLRLYWQIEDAYYLYQHRFDVTLTDRDGNVPLDVQLPAGLEKTDEFFGDVVVYYHNADVLVSPLRDSGPAATLSVTSQGCADAGLCYPPHTETFAVNLATGSVEPSTNAPPVAPSHPAATALQADIATLGTMILLAFLGGMILNLMPCVFPVLSLKVLSFANSTDHDRHLHSWVYSLGVVASFIAVAALLLALKQAGQAIGWGFQLQSPGFVIALAYVFVAMGLSLSGLIHFGGSLMNTGSELAGRGGLSGSFFTGVLAVVVASPCTAPFMGTALGFAVSQPPAIALLVFAALGAGMAAPLLLFSYSGAARKLMPAPGAWMNTLQQFLAFPLYATAIWLLWVAGRQTGVNTMATALAGALMLALGLWLWSQQGWRRGLALACLAAAIGLGSLRDEGNTTASSGAASHLVWSDAAVAAARSEGIPVFVDVTADWCITCKANEAAVLSTEAISNAFAAGGIAYMVADWTNHNREIAELLERYGRTGIPLYLMYPGDPAREPLILPQILTPQTVLDAISEVALEKADVAPTITAR